MLAKWRWLSIAFFIGLAALGGWYIPRLQFSFDFEQFFPKGDPDLEFFLDFIESFETDDNFLLVGLNRPQGAFDSTFLAQVHDFTIKARDLPYVELSESITKFSYPVKTPFGLASIPAIHLDDPSRYEADKERILNDPRLVYNLISPNGNTLVAFLKNKDSINLEEAKELMGALETLVAQYDFPGVHFMGRAYFQRELVRMQQREIIVSAIISGILVALIMFLIFRRPWGIFISLTSIGLGMLLFVTYLGLFGRELNAMAALYPVLMIIVGTSDVIHIMSKYIDEIRKGNDNETAIRTTVREIGLATLLTSITTAIGFATLVTSRLTPIQEFGVNAAVGVLIAYVTVIGFTTCLLPFFNPDQLIKTGRGAAFWQKWMDWANERTILYPRKIAWGTAIVLALCALGISLITTNYNIINNMPRGEKITEDFKFFERELSGFRPLEFAIYIKDGYTADDFAVVQQIDALETHLKAYPEIRAISSPATFYKSINQAFNNNNPDAYVMPQSEQKFKQYQRLLAQAPKKQLNVLVNKDKDRARITSRMLDIGAESINASGEKIDQWVSTNIDTSIMSVHRTGTGLIIDKNSVYVRENLLQGLGLAMLIVSLMMVLIFRNWRMLLISLVPNLFPLLLAGALLGFLGIELEAGVAIVFAVIFGIAVDDTVHFLSKYRLARAKGLNIDDSIQITFRETGKAICLTSIILFFGFLVMLFSIHPPSVTIGLLISLTLVSALVADMLLIPVMIRKWLKE